jgi:hypothetical protein
MNRTVKILAAISLFLVAAAFILGRAGMKAGAGLVPVADPTELMFDSAEEPGASWIGIGMILLLAGLSTSLAAIRCWLQNKSELKGFSQGAADIVPKG